MKPDYILFTDGSYSTLANKGKGVGVYAFIAVVNATEIVVSEYDTVEGKTSSYTEALAIEYGLRYIRSRIKSEETRSIVVISDALNIVNDINEYLNENRRGKNSHYEKAKACFKRIYELVDSSAIDAHFIHVNSHLKESDADKVISSLKREFGFRVSAKVAKQIIHFNNQVDLIARTNLRKLVGKGGKGK